MFTIDATLTDLVLREKNLFKVLFSMNQHQVATPELSVEDARSCVFFWREGGKVNVLVGLYFIRTGARQYYTHSSNPFSESDLPNIEDEARSFTEDLGAMLDEVDFGKLSSDDKKRWFEELDSITVGKKETETDAGAASDQPARVEIDQAGPATETIPAAPAFVADLWPLPVHPPASVEPTAPVQAAAPVEPAVPIQPSPPVEQTIPVQSAASVEPTAPAQAAAPVGPVVPIQPAVLVEQAISIQPVSPVTAEPMTAPSPVGPAAPPPAAPWQGSPVTPEPQAVSSPSHPSPAVRTNPAGVEPHPERPAPGSKKLPLNADGPAPSETQGTESQTAGPVLHHVEDLLEKAVKAGVVKAPKAQLKKDIRTAGTIRRDKEALARLLASF